MALAGVLTGVLLTAVVLTMRTQMDTDATVGSDSTITQSPKANTPSPTGSLSATSACVDSDDEIRSDRRNREALMRNRADPPLFHLHTRPVVDYRWPSKIEQGGFRRVGTLTGEVDGQTQVLPLMSRPTIYPNRFNYYTTTPGYGGQPVYVHYQGRDCMTDRGCDEIYDSGEPVEIPGLSASTFNATVFA